METNKIKIYNLSGSIDITIKGKLENEFEETVAELPEEIKKLFEVSPLLSMVAIQLDTNNGTVSCVYKRVKE